MSKKLSDVKNKINSIESTYMGKKRLEYIRQKIEENDFDNILPDENGEMQEVLSLLIYEYGIGAEKVTKGRCSLEFIVDKLTKTMGKFRFGMWREEDSNVIYGKGLNDESAMSVTSEEYAEATKNFGAHQCIFFDQDGHFKEAVALLRTDLTNLDDIRQTVFHEWTHVLGTTILNEEQFEKEGVPLTYSSDGDSYINGEKTKNGEYVFHGISTAKIIDNENTEMHNMIDEGWVEEIAKRIMITSGNVPLDEGRYDVETGVATLTIDVIHEDRAIADYLTQAHRLKYNLETMKNGDMLHQVSNMIVDINELKGMFRNIEKLLPQEAIQNLRHHKFFEYKTYGKDAKESIEDLKKVICDELTKAEKIDDRSVRGYSRVIDKYVIATNGIESTKEYLRSLIEKRTKKKDVEKFDDKGVRGDSRISDGIGTSKKRN